MIKKLLYFSLLSCIIVVACKDVRHSIDLNQNGKIEVYEDTSRSLSVRAKDVLSRLNLEQKVQLLVGRGMSIPGMPGPEIKQKVPGAAGSTHPLDSLGIPFITMADGPAGLRIQPIRNRDSTQTYYATAFPIASLMASTWDTSLLKSVGKAMGSEVKEYGVDIFLAPALNIHRNPLTGRNFEYYSEDPFLAGQMSAAMVNGVESNGVGTSIKHFAANNQETNRMIINTIVSERALREIYLRGFKIAVQKAQPWTVMSAYNTLNGTPASQNKELLTSVLRDDWGFKGLVMTDWFAGRNATEQMQAGNDLIMPGTPQQQEAIISGVQKGDLNEAVIDRNAQQVLEAVLKSPTIQGYDYSDDPDLEKHAEVARKAAAEGMVLLENKQEALPVTETSVKIAAFGNTSYDFIAGGTGSGDVNEAYTVSMVEGLESAGYTLDESLKNSYQDYLKEKKAGQPKRESIMDQIPRIPEMEVAGQTIEQEAAESDVAFITIGRNSGEFADRKKEGDFYLTDTEHALIDNVTEAFHAQNKKVVAILNIGNVIEMESWKDQVDAVLLAWQGGQESGNAVADVISGKVNPSGKLPTTFSVDYDDVPSSQNFPGKELADEPVMGPGGFAIGTPSEVVYEEGIYVGYRYFNTFDVKPAYHFGYGLSYTTFLYDNLITTPQTFDDEISVEVTVTNSGDTAGKEVVQLYLTAPQGELDKPALELKGFAKTQLLEPGESETLSFTVSPKDLASYHPEKSAWIADEGKYEVKIGASSADIKLTDTFNLPKQLTVEKTTNALTPNREINHRY